MSLDLTELVEVAARAAHMHYVDSVAGYLDVPVWNDLDALRKHDMREMVLPMVTAIAEPVESALASAWDEGFIVGANTPEDSILFVEDADNPYRK